MFHAATHESKHGVLRNGESGRRGVGRGGGAESETDSHVCCSYVSRDRQDCFRKVKISRALEPFLPPGGGVVVEVGEGKGVGDDGGEEG